MSDIETVEIINDDNQETIILDDDTQTVDIDSTDTFSIQQEILPPVLVQQNIGLAGKSAYEVAVKNGFVGSEDDWLLTLKASYETPEDGIIEYSVNGDVTGIIVGDVTTLFNRNTEGDIISIEKESFIKEFIRDVDGRITGWSIIPK